MVRYRCYFFEDQVRVLATRDFFAGNGDEAIATARKLTLEQKARSYELWEGTRYFHGERC
jgi:hypothetical protein